MQPKDDEKPESKPLSQRLIALFRQNSIRNSLLLLLLLVAISSTLYLTYKQSPVIIVALVYLLPLVFVITDSVRDKLAGKSPRWPTWLMLMIYYSVVIGEVSLFLSDYEIGSNNDRIYNVTFLFSALSILIIMLPRLLSSISKILTAIPYLGAHIQKVVTPAGLYIVLLFLAPALVLGASDKGLFLTLSSFFDDLSIFGWVATSIIILSLLSAVIWRKLLWQEDDRLFPRLLPHLAGWLLFIILILVSLDTLVDFGLDDSVAVVFTYTTIFFSPLVFFYCSQQSLQGFTVKPLTLTSYERSDSIQSDVNDFIDVQDHSARLVGSINRSDAGVFGVTGVRGAGKSALTRHVLSELKEQYFVMEITAPVRHDADLGFFISVCRSICRKVLDDLDNILLGKQSGDTAQLKRRFRNIMLPLLLFIAGISSIWHLIPTIGSKIGTVSELNSTPLPVRGEDPLLGASTDLLASHIIVASERRIIDSLLSQMDIVLSEQSDSEQRLKQSTEYFLLPLSSGKGFYLAIDYAPYELETHLKLHGIKQGQDIFNPIKFLNIVSQLNDFICSPERSFITSNRGIAFMNHFNVGEFEAQKYGHDCRDKSRNRPSIKYNSDLFQNNLDVILEIPSIKGPLAQLHTEIQSLLSTPQHEQYLHSDNQDQKSLQNNSSCELLSNPRTDTAETNLVSLLILKAFCYQDPRISFDSNRLEKFRQLLRIYRRMLDGELTASPVLSSSIAGSKISLVATTYLPSLDLQNIPSQVFWSVIVLIIILLSLGPIWRGFISLSRAVVNRRYLNLYHEADKFIKMLSYTFTHQDSRSLGFKGISLGQNNTRSARDLTLPGLTARYLTFIELIRQQYNLKVIIVIDELDKIHDPDQVKLLLTEIKGALFCKGCFYLISISEDAARSFRYRLTSGRDIFESTFDEIIEIQQMDVQSGCAMLSQREENVEESSKLPQPCLVLPVLFGGGIPREIIRASRMLSLQMNNAPELSFSWATHLLLQEDISNWISHFGETNLNGEETIKLKNCAQLAFAQFEDLPDATKPNYSEVSAHLQSCLNIIDPDNLRKSVGFVDNFLNTDNSRANPGNMQQARYQALTSDIQACLRLMILSTIAELTEKTGNDWEQYEKWILACHHALGDKPALTETLLQELRTEHGLEI